MQLLPVAKNTQLRYIVDSRSIETAILYLNMFVQTPSKMYAIEWADDTYGEIQRARDACVGVLKTAFRNKFARRYMMYEALKIVGLDIRGGVEELHQVRNACIKGKPGFRWLLSWLSTARRHRNTST
jgi:hypothetical protein